MPFARSGHQAFLAHEPCNALRARRQSFGLQLLVHPRRAIGLAALLMNDADTRHEDFINERMPARRPLERRVVARR
jgi:hypothetical protein